MLAVYFGHHKCASTWIRYHLQYVCEMKGLRYFGLSSTKQMRKPLADWITDFQDVDVLTFGNSTWADVESYADRIRGLHVIRDPRDITVSAYFSHLHSHRTIGLPDIQANRAKLSQLSKSEGLLFMIEHFMGSLIEQMAEWDYDTPDVFETTFEKITEDPSNMWEWIQGFLQLDMAFDKIGEIVERNAWEKHSGRSKGEADNKAHWRKGISGDWKNHFEPVHEQRFAELHGEQMRRLGYVI